MSSTQPSLVSQSWTCKHALNDVSSIKAHEYREKAVSFHSAYIQNEIFIMETEIVARAKKICELPNDDPNLTISETHTYSENAIKKYLNEIKELLLDDLKNNKKYIIEIGELKQKNNELEQKSCVKAVQCLTQKLEKSIEELNEEKEAGFALKNKNETLEKDNAELTTKMMNFDVMARCAEQNRDLRKQIAEFEFERSIANKKHNDGLAKLRENIIAGIY
jgi:hypothetical protein